MVCSESERYKRSWLLPPPGVRGQLEQLVLRWTSRQLESSALYRAICLPLSDAGPDAPAGSPERVEVEKTGPPSVLVPNPTTKFNLAWSFSIAADACEGIGDCLPVCPVECIHWAEAGNVRNTKGARFVTIDDSRCISCGACASVCPISFGEAIRDYWAPDLKISAPREPRARPPSG